MHLWRNLADPRWLSAYENVLQARSGGRLVIISRPGRKRLQLEIACRSRNDSLKLVEEFGGRTEKWPRNWLERFEDVHKSEPLKIGNRLLISREVDLQNPEAYGKRPTTQSSRKRGTSHKIGRSRQLPCVTDYTSRDPSSPAQLRMGRGVGFTGLRVSFLLIPASAAFGTGEHVTTSMSLRFLEQLTREWEDGWSLADLGTGSGILALAAKRFGAKRVVAVDVDPTAISIAKANARLNKIDNVDFRLADVRKWKPKATWEVVVANLYSQLLIQILPQLRRGDWLILSGVLRRQEKELIGALRRTKIRLVRIKRRGRWIAVLANCSGAL